MQFAHVSRSVNMEWGFKENRVAVIALHKCGESDSKIFKLLKPLKISRNFVYLKIKRYKELWSVEDRARSGRLKSLRADASIKTDMICFQSGFRRILSGNRRSCPESWTCLPNQVVSLQGRSTHDSEPPLKGTPPYSCSEGDPMDKSRVSPPVARRERVRKHPLHGQENFYRCGAV